SARAAVTASRAAWIFGPSLCRWSGVIPPSDYDELFASGAKAVFGPGTNIPEAAADLVEKLNAQLGYADKQAAE
ncbi:MAG: hypothetical protein CTY39_09165, partial [Hyphomicrobium sp.]